MPANATNVLWLATGNAKKRVELERLLAPLGTAVRTLAEAEQQRGGAIPIIEDQPDFAGNAAKKAIPLAAAMGGVALGDDSGLCVDALDGAPGVRSARWAGPGATDADRIEKLRAELQSVGATEPAQRKASFVCAICLAGPDAQGNTVVRATFQGRCEGRILEAPRGSGGFGYDPVFVPIGDAPEPSSTADLTFAELDAEAKDRLSHRGKALRQLLQRLLDHPELLR